MQVDDKTLYELGEDEELFPIVDVGGVPRIELGVKQPFGGIGGGATVDPPAVGHLFNGTLICKGYVYADDALAYPTVIKHIEPDE